METRDRLWPALVLTVLSTGFGLVLIEAGARIAAVREEHSQGRLNRDLPRIKGPSPGSAATLGQIIRKSSNPKIVYELRPRLDVSFAGARLVTSDAGHRGRDVATPKPLGAYRIVGIGDSYMFGQGVSGEETYLAQMEVLLNGRYPARKIETVNLAAPGYNTVMEVATLRARAPKAEPDAVLIEIVGNDLDLPNFLWSDVDPWTLRRSFLLDWIRTRLQARPRPTNLTPGLSEAPRKDAGASETFARDADHVPAAYASMVGLPAFQSALKDLAGIAQERRIPVLALTHGVWFEPEMLGALAEDHIPVLVLRSPLRQRARALGAPDYARSPLALSAEDLHPSALGHRAIAEELAVWLATELGPKLTSAIEPDQNPPR